MFENMNRVKEFESEFLRDDKPVKITTYRVCYFRGAYRYTQQVTCDDTKDLEEYESYDDARTGHYKWATQVSGVKHTEYDDEYDIYDRFEDDDDDVEEEGMSE